MRSSLSIPFLLLAAAAPGRVAAQSPFPAPVRALEARGQEVADALNAGDDGLAERRRAAFDAAVDELLAAEQLLTTRDYNRCATVAMVVGCRQACQKIARFVIARLEQPGQLREFLGIANVELSQRADTDAEMRALSSEAAAALEVWCEEKPGSIGPHYLLLAYATLGEWQKALVWDDRLVARRSNIASPPFFRTILTMGSERWEQALVMLRNPELAEVDEEGSLHVLVSRAEAMLGNADAAVAVARAGVERKATDVAVAALADALAAAGKFDAALDVLEKHPMTGRGDDSGSEASQRKSRAVLGYLIGLRGKRPPDLRQHLARLLEVRFVVVGAAGGDATAQSPWALGWTSRKVPSGPSSWANDLLFAVCVRDAANYVQPEAERKLLGAIVDEPSRAALVGEQALADALRNVRAQIVFAESPGALVVRRLLEKL